MSALLMWDNLVRYSLQIGLLVGLAAFVPAAFRLRTPAARLLYWHVLLGACLLLPALRTWKQEIVMDSVGITSRVVAVSQSAPAPRWRPSPAEGALLLLAAGILGRLAFLGAGFWRLRQYRRHAVPLEPAPSWGSEAAIYLSGDVSGPVTFGIRKPAILLPANFPELDTRMQDAILCHEVLHVRRRDWLFTMFEELVRAVFWFHPAIWWLLGEIGLAREQAVDREVVDITRSRDEYLDALLAMAGVAPTLDLAPAPLFLRKRHLRHRVVSILKETRVSRARLLSAMAAGLMVLAGACWFITGTIPLAAAPQVMANPSAPVAKAPAVVPAAADANPPQIPQPAGPAAEPTPDRAAVHEDRTAEPPDSADQIPHSLAASPEHTGEAVPVAPIPHVLEEPQLIRVGGSVQQSKLISQPRPTYPAEAKAAGIQGLVRMQATIDREGKIRNLELLSGHPMLAPAAMDAVRQWVYAPTWLNGNPVEVVTQIDVNYALSR